MVTRPMGKPMVTNGRVRVRLRAAAAVVALATAGTGLVGCELPPVPVLLVNATGVAPDAVPGDGWCESTAGGGDCSLVAAIDEANALGAADLVVPAGEYGEPGVSLVVSGRISINVDDPQPVKLAFDRLTVAAGGVLDAEGVTLWLSPLVVDGSATWRRGGVSGLDVGVYVSPTGTFVGSNSLIQSGFSSVVVNDGTAVLLSSTIYRFFGPSGITTGAGATTTISSTAILQSDQFPWPTPSTSCAGSPPVSNGFNVAWDLSCELEGQGDIEAVGSAVEAVPGDWLDALPPTAGSPLVDAIPVDVNGCAGAIGPDRLGHPRPADGDGDGVAACDIGAFERVP